MKEEYLVFYLENRELLAYTVRGTFAGELDATKDLLTYEYGIKKEAIQVIKEYR